MKKLVFASIFILSSPFVLAQSETTIVAPAPVLPWTATLRSEMASNIQTGKELGGAGTETQFRLAYKFNDQAQLGLLIGGKYNLATINQDQADQEMIASNVAVAGLLVAPSFWGSDKTEIDARIYFPTSEQSGLLKENFQVRADIKLPYTIASQRTATVQLSPRVTDYAVTDSKFELVSQAKLAQGKAIVPYLAMNHRIKVMGGEAMSRTEEFLGPELGIDLIPHKIVKISLSVSQERNILNPTSKKVRSEYSAFDTRETKYLMGAQIKL
ncbi:MAG: hypothetical protein RJB66_1108 [Pseudomonadota bacterium]|jgi:hypothetical protein